MKGCPEYASAAEYMDRVRELLPALPAASERFVEVLYKAFEGGHTIFLAGNGGSAAAASHLAQDLAKGTLSSVDSLRRFRVVSLTDNVGYITALANDAGYERIFEQQLIGLARPRDLLVAISCSGNSANVLRAVDYAASIGMKTVAVTGFDGGELRSRVDEELNVPVDDVGMAEALHAVVFHYAMTRLRARLARLDER